MRTIKNKNKRPIMLWLLNQIYIHTDGYPGPFFGGGGLTNLNNITSKLCNKQKNKKAPL